MAISKRLRFEILRRDGFKCRYCHGSEVLLTVDHVTPLALGGTDHPSNLVACCDDCNTGKASTVARVSDPAEPELGEDNSDRTIFDDFGDAASWPRLLRGKNVSAQDIEVARKYLRILYGQMGTETPLAEFLMRAVRERDLFAIESLYAVSVYDTRQRSASEGATV